MTALADNYVVASGATLYAGRAAPPTGIPSWVPPSGYFADIPATNVPDDVTPSIYAYGAMDGTFLRWGGAAMVYDYSALGAVVHRSGGHSPGQEDVMVNLVFDLSTLAWSVKNTVNTSTGHKPDVAGQLDPNTGLYYSDNQPMNPHTYLGVQEFPAAWGGGAKGSLAQFLYAGSTNANRINLFDLSQPLLGSQQMTTVQAQNAAPGEIRFNATAAGGNYPMSVTDYGRQGWWLDVTGNHDYILFVSKTGAITQYPAIGGGIYSSLVLVESKNLLILLNGNDEANARGMRIRDLATGVTNTVNMIGTVPGGILQYDGITRQYRPEQMGMQWVEELGCIVGIDHQASPVSLVKITPPVSNPATTGWTVTYYPLQHWTASDPTGYTAMREAANGNFSKFQWNKNLQAFVLATSNNTKPQVLKL